MKMRKTVTKTRTAMSWKMFDETGGSCTDAWKLLQSIQIQMKLESRNALLSGVILSKLTSYDQYVLYTAHS